MTITIAPEETHAVPLRFQARAGNVEATGETVGAALDALDAVLPEPKEGEVSGTLVLVQRFRPDNFFAAPQQVRLSTLMERFRAARDAGQRLPDAEYQELESLVQAEVVGMGKRAQASNTKFSDQSPYKA